MKTLRCVITAVIFLAVSAHAEIMDRIVAIVNGEVITLSELNNVFEPFRKRIEASYRGEDKDKVIAENGQLMLHRLIDNLLVDQEAKKSAIVVKDAEVIETINDILVRKNIKMNDLLAELARENTTFEAYKKDLKAHILKMRLVRRDIKSKIIVTEEEIGEYYQKHREAYEGQESVSINQILLLYPRNADEKMKEKLRAQMEAILKRLRNGESFDFLAARYSQGPAAATGGDIGFMKKGTMLPAVDNVAFSLKKDEVSGIIESPLGLHIIKVIDKRGAGIKSIETIRQEIKTKLEDDKLDKKYEEWIKELRKKAVIETKL